MPVFSKIIIFSSPKAQRNKGFTLIELVVASAVALTILGISLGMITEQRRWVLGDQTRASANDNLRLASDLIGQDIKQAGERLESNAQLSGISIIAGTLGAPSTLVLQRQLLQETLPVCQSIGAGTTSSTIDVSVLNGIIAGIDYGSAVANCTYSYAVPSGGEPSTALTSLKPTANLRSWRTFRCTQNIPASPGTDPCASTGSTTAWAYIYQQDSPGLGHGEFFEYSTEGQGSCVSSTAFPAPSSRTCQKIQRTGSTGWKYSYTYNPNAAANDTSQPRIYLLEERRYSVTPDVDTARTDDYILKLSINQQTDKRIANQISNFQVWGKVPSSYTAVPFSAPTSWGCAAGGAAATAPNPALPNQWYCNDFNNISNSDPYLRPQFIKDWQELQGVRVSLTGLLTDQQKQALTQQQQQQLDPTNPNSALKLTSEFFPRNVASR
jgi:type II secretory pathway pseudopilin PulG